MESNLDSMLVGDEYIGGAIVNPLVGIRRRPWAQIEQPLDVLQSVAGVHYLFWVAQSGVEQASSRRGRKERSWRRAERRWAGCLRRRGRVGEGLWPFTDSRGGWGENASEGEWRLPIADCQLPISGINGQLAMAIENWKWAMGQK